MNRNPETPAPEAGATAGDLEVDPPGSGRRGADGRIAYLLRQAAGAVRHAMDAALRDLDLTLPQFSILTLVAAYDRPSGAALARLSLLTPQTVHGVLRTLERRGLLSRAPHPAHGRVLALALTAEGRALLARARRRVHRIEAEMVAGLPPEEEAVIRRWLAGLAAHHGER